jgi:hypothetical protein
MQNPTDRLFTTSADDFKRMDRAGDAVGRHVLHTIHQTMTMLGGATELQRSMLIAALPDDGAALDDSQKQTLQALRIVTRDDLAFSVAANVCLVDSYDAVDQQSDLLRRLFTESCDCGKPGCIGEATSGLLASLIALSEAMIYVGTMMHRVTKRPALEQLIREAETEGDAAEVTKLQGALAKATADETDERAKHTAFQTQYPIARMFAEEGLRLAPDDVDELDAR